METQSSFDLNRAIQTWRENLANSCGQIDRALLFRALLRRRILAGIAVICLRGLLYSGRLVQVLRNGDHCYCGRIPDLHFAFAVNWFRHPYPVPCAQTVRSGKSVTEAVAAVCERCYFDMIATEVCAFRFFLVYLGHDSSRFGKASDGFAAAIPNSHR
jgi:hypothetical protein